MYEEGLSWSTIEVAYCAIKFSLRARNAPGWEPPRNTPREVQLHFDGLTRILTRQKKRKDPIRLDDLLRMIRKTGGNDIRAVRDRALLLIHFWGAFRRSEVVALNFEDVKWSSEGVVLHLKRSKTDQEGVGRDVAIQFAEENRLCAPTALRRWMDLASIEGEGAPVFRPIDRYDVVGGTRLTDWSVNLTIKKYAKRAGLDPSKVSGHSMRSGFVTEAATQGVSLDSIMKQTGHHSVEQVREYIRTATPFENNPTGQMGRRRD
jgi:integrase